MLQKKEEEVRKILADNLINGFKQLSQHPKSSNASKFKLYTPNYEHRRSKSRADLSVTPDGRVSQSPRGSYKNREL